jgi:hypothetical protein
MINRITTIDIEAYLDKKNKFIPFAIGIFNKKIGKKIFLKDENNVNHNVIAECFDYIWKNRKTYNDMIFYAHNLSKFDSYLILENIAEYGYRIELIKDDSNGIISATIIKDGFKIKLQDSIKMLNGS